MNKGKARSSQLIIFDDGTLYHIDLKKSDGVPPNILLVGAAERVDLIASHFDRVEFRHRNSSRPEFYTAAGTYKGVPVAAMSIGIGVGPVDIAINELHALFEYDHSTDSWAKEKSTHVNIIRVGTCGSSLPEVPAGALTVSKYAIGLDNLGAYYPLPSSKNRTASQIESEFLKTIVGKVNPLSYCSAASPLVVGALIESAGHGECVFTGITTASPGFFGPEGRQIGSIRTAFGPEEFRNVIQSFELDGMKIVNHEMETSILFRLGYEQLGYNVGAICLMVDNLATDEVLTSDEADKRMKKCIRTALDSLVLLSE